MLVVIGCFFVEISTADENCQILLLKPVGVLSTPKYPRIFKCRNI
jgi:hypothetical protein